MKDLIREEKGGAIVIVFLIMLPLLFASVAYINEMQRIATASNVNLKNTAALGAKAAAQSVEETSQAHGHPLIDHAAAHQNFRMILQRNLKLDEHLEPMPNSPLKGALNYYLLICNGTNEHDLPQGLVYRYENGSLSWAELAVGDLPASFGVNKNFEVTPEGKVVQLDTPGVVVIIEAGIRPVAANVGSVATRWAAARVIY